MEMFANFTEETCTGTGATLALAGAVAGRIAFNKSFADGDLVAYVLEDSGGVIIVAGVGTYVAATDDITRADTWNWNGAIIDENPAVNLTLSAGTHTVRCGPIDNQLIGLIPSNPEILGGDADGTLFISPSTANALGGNIVLYGDTHSTKARDIEFRATAGVELAYSDSASKWNFQANAIETSGIFTSTNITDSTSATTGSGIFSGGVGIAKDIFSGGSFEQANTTGPSHNLKNTDASLNSDQLIGEYTFEKSDPSGAGVGIVGGLRMYSSDSIGTGAYLTFSTSNSSANNVECLRLNNSLDAIFAGDVSITKNIIGSQLIKAGAGATGSRPTPQGAGSMWFDTTLGKPIWHDGTNWVDATGTSV